MFIIHKAIEEKKLKDSQKINCGISHWIIIQTMGC
jgi:hypothetical protein